MKAIRVHQFGGPEVLQLDSVEVPSPGRGEVVVRLKAIGVNPVDTYWRSGLNPSLKPPFIPGLDAAGEVDRVGEGVQKVRQGDRVYVGGTISGTYAEYTLAKVAQVHRLPENVGWPEGAALHVPYATAHRALFHRGEAKAGETVLIHGASGGVGVAAIQFASAAGLFVVGTAGTDKGRCLVLEQGAHAVFDHRAPHYLDAILKLTQGRGVDLVLEMLANVNLGAVLPYLAPHGRVVVIGSRGKVEVTPRDLMSRDADVRGMSLFNVEASEMEMINLAIQAGLQKGFLKPIIAGQLPLEQASEVHRLIMEPGAYGKWILTP